MVSKTIKAITITGILILIPLVLLCVYITYMLSSVLNKYTEITNFYMEKGRADHNAHKNGFYPPEYFYNGTKIKCTDSLHVGTTTVDIFSQKPTATEDTLCLDLSTGTIMRFDGVQWELWIQHPTPVYHYMDNTTMVIYIIEAMGVTVQTLEEQCYLSEGDMLLTTVDGVIYTLNGTGSWHPDCVLRPQTCDCNRTEIVNDVLMALKNDTGFIEDVIVENIVVGCNSSTNASNIPYMFKDNLLAYWDFTERFGLFAYDTSGFSSTPLPLETSVPSNTVSYMANHWKNPCGFHMGNTGLPFGVGSVTMSVGAPETDEVFQAINITKKMTIEFWVSINLLEYAQPPHGGFLQLRNNGTTIIGIHHKPSTPRDLTVEIGGGEGLSIRVRDVLYEGFHDMQIILKVQTIFFHSGEFDQLRLEIDGRNRGEVTLQNDGVLFPLLGGVDAIVIGYDSSIHETGGSYGSLTVYKLAIWDIIIGYHRNDDDAAVLYLNTQKCPDTTCDDVALTLGYQ